MTELDFVLAACREPLTVLWLIGLVVDLAFLALVCLALRDELLRRERP